MSANLKANLIYFFSFLVIFFVFKIILGLIFNFENQLITSFFSAALAAALSSRKTIVTKQSGKEIQLKFIFSKRIFIVK
ncbi:hypothetical protein DFQ05_1629 [Winogradskyella wandonensis]|uniref:Uncharacterized protein n=1 Tax=Winogradskyella wandonensis TaxID=1442586 RepID=A0A4R1KTI2_9FLAO|nr:hypothetical protein DFQ05_1629 [Winogradskyella wandonensis]